MINILSGLGISAAVAVWAAALRGIGQSLARVCEVLFGARIHPFALTIFATAILSGSFILGITSGEFVLTAFVVGY